MLTRRRFIQTSLTSVAIAGLTGFLSSVPIAYAFSSVNIPVFLYHRVGNTNGELTITPEKFEKDLIWLNSRGYSTISLDTLRGFFINSDIALPEKPIMISFDDGYLDNFMNAYPLLRKYGMTAAFFIITSMVNGEDRLATGHIREMASNGMSIGSHTVSHRPLGDMESEEALNELSLSRMYLEGMLQKKIDFVAYPKGSYNGSTGMIASEAGYCGGFSIIPGTCSRNTNPFVIPRVPLFSYDGDMRRTMVKYGLA